MCAVVFCCCVLLVGLASLLDYQVRSTNPSFALALALVFSLSFHFIRFRTSFLQLLLLRKCVLFHLSVCAWEIRTLYYYGGKRTAVKALFGLWEEKKNMSECKGENAFSLFVRVCMCVLSKCMWMYLCLCVVENSISRAPHSRNFPIANTHNFFPHTVVLYIEAFWFRFSLPHFIHSNKKKKKPSFTTKKPTFIFVRLHSIVTLCDLCVDILSYSLEFHTFCFYFYFDVRDYHSQMSVFVNSYRHMQIFNCDWTEE